MINSRGTDRRPMVRGLPLGAGGRTATGMCAHSVVRDRMKITIATGPLFTVPAVAGGAIPRMWLSLAEEFVGGVTKWTSWRERTSARSHKR